MDDRETMLCGSPEMLSLMGYSLARESGQIRTGIEMCRKALSLNPHNVDHYLNLGRIYLLAGNKAEAIRVFKKGLKIRRDPRIIAELKQLGIRKPPPFGTLSREHLLNRVAGKVLQALRLR